MNVLVVNPGGNSLKIEIVSCIAGQRRAFEGVKLASVSAENIGKAPRLLEFKGKRVVHSDPIHGPDYAQAFESLIAWLRNQTKGEIPEWKEIECVGLRVVHGGPTLHLPARITPKIEQQIAALERLAPLHNRSSIEVLEPIRRLFPRKPVYAVFDTAFHRTIPEYACTYAIPLDLTRKHHIRRYGFHGISHRYMLERYAHLAGKTPEDCTLVTMHLESGCSVTAIRDGESVDNTMGLTPLEGLMMGTRSGDVDPSLIPFLMNHEGMTVDDVMTLLNRKSGLRGVSGRSLDTRVLIREYSSSARARLAMNMFSYRVLKAVGAYLAALGGADAIVFGGGIGENGKYVREFVGHGLHWFGCEIDRDANRKYVDIEGRLSTPASRIEAWVIPVEEGLEIAHECSLVRTT
jgi:acetate kinase